MRVIFNTMIKYFLILTLIALNSFAFDAFIKPSELKDALNDKNIIILDVSDHATYRVSHINHAINFDISTLIPKEENPYMLMDKAQNVQAKLKDLGINTNSNVIIYSHNREKGILDSSYLAFILIYNGFENVSILDGGYMAWIFQNELLISTQKFTPEDDGNFEFHQNKNLLVDMNYVEQNPANALIFDARTTAEYYGVSKSKKIIGIGHIPHAKSNFYKYNFLADGSIRDDEELSEIYLDGYDISKANEMIVYGNNIYDASMLWYIIYQKMGFKNTKLYGASLLEWGNNTKLPMKRFKWE